jgi:arginase
MPNPPRQQAIHIIGVPTDHGQSRRGVDMGPSAVRYAGLQTRIERLGLSVRDFGNLNVHAPEEVLAGTNAKRLGMVTEVCQRIYDFGRECIASGNFALFLGGDHSLSIGTVSAAAEAGPIGMIWIDAHGDFNTPETSPSGNIHGMPVAVLCGEGPPELVNLGRPGAKLQPAHVAQIAIRDLDPPERERLSKSGVQVYTMRDVDEHGIAEVTRRALDGLRHLERIHVSLDMDSISPDMAPGVGTPVPGGLTDREAHLLMEILHDDGRVRSMDVVEVNPILDHRNRTAELAVDLVLSLLGQRII